MQRRIAGLVWNSLRIHGLDKAFGRNPSKLLLVHVENISILAVAGAARIEFLRRDAGNLAQQAIEQARILMADLGLRVEAHELRIQDRALPFAQPVVRSINEMAVEPFARHAPAIVHGAGQPFKLVVIRNDDAALAGGYQFAGLKAEGP